MYKEIELKQIRAKGWIAEFLKTQANGITGHLDQLGEPFSGVYWDEDNVENVHRQSRFLGGLNSKNDAWVPYEQTGYWIDGMVRTAHLIENTELMKKAAPKVYNPIQYAHQDGFLGPAFLKDDMVWAHSVYFRALMAEYSATGDGNILEALKQHYLRVPLKDVYAKRDDLKIITVRDVCDIEGALWIYGQTGDKRFLQMAEESYLEFNRLFADDRGSAPHCKSRALTLKGMLGEDKADNNHGVTYCEVCKLAAILHMYTGKLHYKEAAVKAFDKVYRDQMIVDGVISSSEYLNGNKSSRAVHEACDVSDFTWAVGYLFMITGDAKYGDWIENAVFNGGIGCLDDELNNHQYFSCPNQVICDDHSNHADFYKGEAWMSYTPTEVMGCCAGNINRFMPNYVCRSWMRQGNGICAFLYAPSALNIQVNGVTVHIEEETDYPFRNTVRFTVTPKKTVSFCFRGRIPGWAKACHLTVNGKKVKWAEEKGFYVIDRKFKADDVIEVTFEDEIQFIPNAGGISVKKGGLLYALPIREKIVTGQKERGLGDPRFAHYGLYPDSAWNYGLLVNDRAEYVEAGVDQTPWKSTAQKSVIRVQAMELPDWKIEEVDSFRQKKHPRKRGKMVKKHCLFTPELPDMRKTESGQEVTLKLVPYCTTRLRIAIFPAVEG